MSIWTRDFMSWAKPKQQTNLGDYGAQVRKQGANAVFGLGCLLTLFVTVPIFILFLLAL